MARRVDVLVLAVKPQVMGDACAALREIIEERQPLIISIAAGVTVDNLRNWLGEAPIVRCMPNTPSLVQAGATGLYAAPDVSAEQKEMAGQILSAVGLTFWFETEGELDAVTAVSGSGPAYVFLLIERWTQAAIDLGFAPEQARLMVEQTVRGASELLAGADVDATELRRRVTSPKGTTERAVAVLEEAELRDLFTRAADAAVARAKEIAAGS